MRISVFLLIFLLLLNGWAVLLQDHGLDDHLGISVEPGDSDKLEEARNASENVRTGNAVGGTLLGMYNALAGTLEALFVGVQPGGQMLANIVPDGPAEDVVKWAYSIVQIIIAVDTLAFFRGVDL